MQSHDKCNFIVHLNWLDLHIATCMTLRNFVEWNRISRPLYIFQKMQHSITYWYWILFSKNKIAWTRKSHVEFTIKDCLRTRRIGLVRYKEVAIWKITSKKKLSVSHLLIFMVRQWALPMISSMLFPMSSFSKLKKIVVGSLMSQNIMRAVKQL